MAGKPSASMVEAMKAIIIDGVTPYRAAKNAGLFPCSMYRSRLYVMWRDGKLKELRKELGIDKKQ